MILKDVKKTLRISHDALDDEINDSIEAARHDLMLSVFLPLKRIMTMIR